jgi:tRNA threonylcarbamoyladenosine biosynthesis protein TsaB
MKILAVDTATRSCSVAITDNDCIVSEITLNLAQTHAAILMSMIHRVLDAAHLFLDDIDGFAITIGPGSFTGLRIGLSTIKGISAATGKPVVGVSTLEALAHNYPYASDCICPMIDARKGQVYCARYRFRDGVLSIELPVRSITPMNAVKDLNEICIFIGDGALAYKNLIVEQLGELALFAHPCHHIIKASVVAHLSLPRFLNGDTEDVAALVPVYARKSDAETAGETQ